MWNKTIVKKYSTVKTAAKGAEPPAFIALGVSVGVGVAKLLGLELDEATIATICSVSVGIYGLYKSFLNWKKNRNQ